MEKIMKWWARITSLVIIFGVFYSIHLGFSYVELYFESEALYQESQALGLNFNRFLPLNQAITLVLSGVFGVICVLYFYSPFFYYGWVKNPNNKDMKFSTKVVTVIHSLSIVIPGIFYIRKSSEIIIIPIALALITPLYYYGWKK